MATDAGFMVFITEQLGEAGVTYRKMFGEYMLYYNERAAALVCDNTVLVKPYAELDGFGLSRAYPYEGSKTLHYVVDPEDRETFRAVMAVAFRLAPAPKPKKRGGRA